jgi:hypothetical protein
MLTPMAANEIRRGKAALVQTWQEAYGLSFCEYRGAVRDACQAELERVGADRLTLGLDGFSEWLRDGQDEVLLPIDDDDTFDPSVIDAVRCFDDPEVCLALWRRRTNFLGSVRTENITRYTDTCNYALRKSFVALWPDPDAAVILAQHWVANHRIASRLNLSRPKARTVAQLAANVHKPVFTGPLVHPCVREVDGYHSTYYLHTGSISFLVGGKMAKHTDTVQYLRGLPLHPLYR